MVDKPPFLLIHPSKPDGTPTLWAALRELLAFELVNGGQVSIVNRLDRETSGLVLIAKNAASARRFGLAMERRHIEKEYLAIVFGWPEWETTTVDAPLARRGAHGPSAIWLKQMIHEKGAPALTDFRVESRFVRPGKPPTDLRSLGQFPAPGARIRSASISRILVMRSSVTKSTDLTSNFTCALSRPAGRTNWSASFFCRGTRSIPRGCGSTINSTGKARCRTICSPGLKERPRICHPEPEDGEGPSKQRRASRTRVRPR